MVVAYVDSVSSEGTDNTLEAAMPAGMSAGEMAVVVYCNDISGHNTTGHKPADSDYLPSTGGDVVGAPDPAWIMVYEPAGTPATQIHSINTADEWLAAVAAYSGVDYSQLITDDTSAIASVTSGGNVTSIQCPAFTPLRDNSMVVYGVVFDSTTGSRTFSTDSDGGGTHTKRLEAQDSSAGLKIAIFDVLQTTAAEIAPTISMTGGADIMSAFILALPPSSSGAQNIALGVTSVVTILQPSIVVEQSVSLPVVEAVTVFNPTVDSITTVELNLISPVVVNQSTITSIVNIELPLISPATIFDPNLTTTVSLQIPLVEPVTIYQPDLASSTGIILELISPTTIFSPDIVSITSISLTLTSPVTIFQLDISASGALTLPLISSATIFEPSITSAVTVDIGLITPTTIFSPSLVAGSAISLDVVNPVTIFDTELISDSVIEIPLTTPVTIFDTEVDSVAYITLPLVDVTTVNTPELTSIATIAISLISPVTIYSPTIMGGIQTVTIALVSPVTFFSPSVAIIFAIPGTTVPLAQDAIYDAIADVVPVGTQVLKYLPIAGVRDQTVIAITGFDELEEEFRALGRSARRQETYLVNVLVAHYNVNAKDDAGVVAVRDTVMELYNYIRYAVHQDHSLGGVVYQASVVNAESLGVQPIPSGGYGMNMDIKVGCKARILSESPA